MTTKTTKVIEEHLSHILYHYISSVKKSVKRDKRGALDLRTQPSKTVWSVISSVSDKKLRSELWEELDSVEE